MKRLCMIIGGIIVVLAWLGTGQAGDTGAILGGWLTEEGEAEVEIYRCGEAFCGKIVWLKEPKNDEGKDKTDINNPDPDKRDQKIIGLNIVWGFRYKGEKWVGGKIYDPDNGKTYKCKMELESEERLKVRGYIGFSLIGRTTIWTRRISTPRQTMVYEN